MAHPGKWKVLKVSVEIKVPSKSPITKSMLARAIGFTLRDTADLFDRRLASYDENGGLHMNPHTKPIVRWRGK